MKCKWGQQCPDCHVIWFYDYQCMNSTYILKSDGKMLQLYLAYVSYVKISWARLSWVGFTVVPLWLCLLIAPSSEALPQVIILNLESSACEYSWMMLLLLDLVPVNSSTICREITVFHSVWPGEYRGCRSPLVWYLARITRILKAEWARSSEYVSIHGSVNCLYADLKEWEEKQTVTDCFFII